MTLLEAMTRYPFHALAGAAAFPFVFGLLCAGLLIGDAFTH